MPNQTIEIATADGSAEAYVTRPDDAEHPGVLFLMDAIGLRPRTKEMADRIASWGYIVLAPNVFYRHGRAADLAPTKDLRLDGNRDEFFSEAVVRVNSLTNDLAREDLARYLEALQGLQGVVGEAVGTTGYCMGGRLTFLAAASFPQRIAAAASFHTGKLVTDATDSLHLRAGSIGAELLLRHADHDHSMTPADIAQLEAELDLAGVTYSSSIYADAAHGYTMSDTSVYDHEASERHFTELEDLLARTLR